MEHAGQSQKLGVSGHVNIQSRIFSVPCLIHQVRIGLPRCQVKFSFTIVGSYHHHPIYMTSPGVFDEQGLCWNPCFLFAGATLRLGGVTSSVGKCHSTWSPLCIFLTFHTYRLAYPYSLCCHPKNSRGPWLEWVGKGNAWISLALDNKCKLLG